MARRWVATEEDDGNECEPCAKIDGTTYRNREDAYADYPGGVGYKDCVGAQFGNACRGKVVKRRGAERAGMTEKRLLASFRNLLAERNAFLAKTAPPIQAIERTGDWFKITNATAEEVTVYIFDEIGFWGTSAKDFTDQLNAITAPKIVVNINSPGGDVFDGLAIHTALASSKAHVTTFVTGVAASAASYIAMAGDTIKMARNATMMIHDASGLTWGNEADHLAQAALLGKLSDNIADMYAMQAGGDVATWRAAMRKETWYTGQEALAAGLVDEITDADQAEEAQPAMANRLSIAVFNYAGRADAPAPIFPEGNGDGEIDSSSVKEEPPPPVQEDEMPDIEDGETVFAQQRAMHLLAALLKGSPA